MNGARKHESLRLRTGKEKKRKVENVRCIVKMANSKGKYKYS